MTGQLGGDAADSELDCNSSVAHVSVGLMADGYDSNGQSDVLRKLGPLTQQQLGRSAAACPRVPASAGLLAVGT